MWAFMAGPGGGDAIKKYFAELDGLMIAVFVAPFAILLLSIAILPLVAHHFWESNRNKGIVAAVCGLPIALFFLLQAPGQLLHTGLEYAAFIALLAALFIISGGIYVRGSFAGLPIVNTAFLGIGAVLANFVGTTGASMLLIRPLLRANAKRKRKVHILVFFIFVVSNCGGCLTPLGDPPLFLGFLRGVPFPWTFTLVPPWLFMVGALLILFNLLDQYHFSKEDAADKGSILDEVARSTEKLGLEGSHNLLFLLGVVGTILFSGYVVYSNYGEMVSMVFQSVVMMGLASISYHLTRPSIRAKNGFSFHPIVEVAALFAGIFAAMIPALLILEGQGKKLGVDQPWHYFWMTGALSSFLDNAPTYLVFTSLAKNVLGISEEGLKGLVSGDVAPVYLTAISLGAVFMGANTYIGNGPNFMVKAIAEEAKIRMPSFFGYMAWSMAILLPLFVVVTLIFCASTFSAEQLKAGSPAGP